MKGKDRIPTDGGSSLGQNPFAGLAAGSLPAAAVPPSRGAAAPAPGAPAAAASGKANAAPPKNRGRVDIVRQTAGRGGKTVTVVSGFVGIGLPEKEDLAHRIQKACGSGGTVKEGRIEIQGDKREIAARILTEAGFRPVFAGG